jgi:hypothetical protein
MKKESITLFIVLIVCAFVIIGILLYYNQKKINEDFETPCNQEAACQMYDIWDKAGECPLTHDNRIEIASCMANKFPDLLNSVNIFLKSKGFKSVDDFLVNYIAKNVGDLIRYNKINKNQISSAVTQYRNLGEQYLSKMKLD